MSNRVGFIAAFLGAVLVIGIAYAAENSTALQTAAADPSQCEVLDGEWKIAEAACSTNANLGRARALAREAATKCKSTDAAQRTAGVGKYQSALRLCRKADGDH